MNAARAWLAGPSDQPAPGSAATAPGQPPAPGAADGHPATAAAPGTDPLWQDDALAGGLSDPLPAHGRAGAAHRSAPWLLAMLLGVALLALWLRALAAQPWIDLTLTADPDGRARLVASHEPALQALLGHRLLAVQGMALPGASVIDHAVATPGASPRWVADDGARQLQQAWQNHLAQALGQASVQLGFDDGRSVTLTPRPRGLFGLGPQPLLLGALALALYAVALRMVLLQPQLRAVLFAVIALCQAAQLLLSAGDALPGLGTDPWVAHSGWTLRLLSELVGAAAVLHLFSLYPTRLPQGPRWALAAWATALGLLALFTLLPPPGAWWWLQGVLVLAALAGVAVLQQSLRAAINPLAAMLQRVTLACAALLSLLGVAVALTALAGGPAAAVAAGGAQAWQVFYAVVLLLVPYLSRSRRVVHEFAGLAGVAATASTLDLLFVAALGIRPLVAVLLALAVSLLLYTVARLWLRLRLTGPGRLGAERMFEGLYRAARALEQAPEQAADALGVLLREVFDPLELTRSNRPGTRIRVAVDGSTLVLPVPRVDDEARGVGTLVLRFAHRGRRLFTQEDVALCERILEQLGRAVAYDRAVEQGRSEERTRIAQDLHDDIGARLLTLMYKAPDPEIESYIRHTLQDLKTLTRGLAASSHRLSHTAAEWKADLSQRLNATGCDLRWSFTADRDINLTVVQWSGLTRVLRELANNIIAHAQASLVEVTLQLEQGRLTLLVSDDGIGRAPETWSHGLGLGGVRKRVKLLGGSVVWRERQQRGISCEVQALLQPGASSR